jgi:hypothetical protein
MKWSSLAWAASLAALTTILAAPACGGSTTGSGFVDNDGGADSSGQPIDGTTGDGDIVPSFDATLDGPGACKKCSSDLHSVLDCQGNVLQTCASADGCDLTTLKCVNACAAAVSNKQSVGCEYYATYMEQLHGELNSCFAVFVANTWNTAAHITVERGGAALNAATFAKIPSGAGQSLSYKPFDPAVGIPPHEVVILFLVGNTGSPSSGSAPCPVPAAILNGVMLNGTGKGDSFRITSDVPVVSYEINPYGGGSAAVTGASLLLPTSSWDTNYIAVNVSQQDISSPSMNIVAMADNTTVKMVPVAAVTGGGGLPAGPANTTLSFMLGKGQHAQFTQTAELTGSVIQSDKPIGFMAGQPCMRAPLGTAYCDHGEQMVPPVRALGSEYVGVMYRPRKGEPAIWRLIGAVDGTTLTYSNAVGGPATLNRGQAVEFNTGTPFVVKSQDAAHPFLMFTLMSGSQWTMGQGMDGYGDPDIVLSVPPQQYMPAYVFFADPTYPETNLVVVRAKTNGKFEDVTLDCAGVLTGWTAVGDYEWTRADLITGNFQNVGACSTGRREMTSKGPFGLWVWGWGTPLTAGLFTANVSYGYPAGMNVQPINQVVIPPTPR